MTETENTLPIDKNISLEATAGNANIVCATKMLSKEETNVIGEEISEKDPTLKPVSEKEVTAVVQETANEFDTEKVHEVFLREAAEYILTNQLEKAIESYSQALEIMTEKYGQLGEECADVYYRYGKALFLQGIANHAILGSNRERAENADDNDDDGLMIQGKGIQIPLKSDDFASGSKAISFEKIAEATAASASASTSAAGASGGIGSKRKIIEFADDMDEPAPANDDLYGDEVSGDQDVSLQALGMFDGGDEEVDDDDFAAAWEVFDLARVIYTTKFKPDNKEAQLKLADIYIALADISMETENFDQAVSDMKQGIIVQERFRSESDRILAESYYKFALAAEFSGKFDDSKIYLKKAIQVLQNRCSDLKSRCSNQSETDDNVKKMQEEISDLQELIPDIEAKIEDLKILEAQTVKDRQTLLETAENLLRQRSSSSPCVADKPVALEENVQMNQTTSTSNPDTKGKAPIAVVNDLSNLVRKKPKQDPPSI